MKKIIFVILLFISAHLQSQNSSIEKGICLEANYTYKNLITGKIIKTNEYKIDKTEWKMLAAKSNKINCDSVTAPDYDMIDVNNALKQFIAFCKIEVSIADLSETNSYSKAYVANAYTEFCMKAFSISNSITNKQVLKDKLSLVLSDEKSMVLFLKHIAQINNCDKQRISFLIRPPENDDRYFSKVPISDAQILSEVICRNFCNSQIDSQAILIAKMVEKEKMKTENLSRKYVYRSMPFNSSNDTGKVVIDIKVDSLGNVIYAKYKPVGSTTSNLQLISLSEQAALKTKFNAVNTKEIQQGTIVYNFSSKE